MHRCYRVWLVMVNGVDSLDDVRSRVPKIRDQLRPHPRRHRRVVPQRVDSVLEIRRALVESVHRAFFANAIRANRGVVEPVAASQHVLTTLAVDEAFVANEYVLPTLAVDYDFASLPVVDACLVDAHDLRNRRPDVRPHGAGRGR